MNDRVRIDGDGAWPVVRLRGDIDLSNADALAQVAEEAVPNTARGLVLDLSRVTYLDSTGLRLVFRLARRLGDRQQALRLVVPDGARIARVLDLAGVAVVADVLPAYDPDGSPTAGRRRATMTARGATSFSVDETVRTAVVRASGEVDAASSRAFRFALERAVQTGRTTVVVDLAEVTFLDSAGLSVVFDVQRGLPVDRQLVLGNVPSRMLRTLRLASVPSVVTVHAEGAPQPWQEPAGPTSGPTS